MKWLDVETVRLNDRVAILTVSRQDVINYHDIVGALTKYRNQEGDSIAPVMLEMFLHNLISGVRPEFNGCCIWLLAYDHTMQCWEIGISHQELPLNALGSVLKKMPLVPELEPAALARGK